MEGESIRFLHVDTVTDECLSWFGLAWFGWDRSSCLTLLKAEVIDRKHHAWQKALFPLKSQAWQWTPLVPALGRQRPSSLWVGSQLGLQSKFKDSQNYLFNLNFLWMWHFKLLVILWPQPGITGLRTTPCPNFLLIRELSVLPYDRPDHFSVCCELPALIICSLFRVYIFPSICLLLFCWSCLMCDEFILAIFGQFLNWWCFVIFT